MPDSSSAALLGLVVFLLVLACLAYPDEMRGIVESILR